MGTHTSNKVKVKMPLRGLKFTKAQREVVIRAGLGNYFRRWETGRSLPTKPLALVIASLTGVPLIECLYGNAPPTARGVPRGKAVKKNPEREKGE